MARSSSGYVIEKARPPAGHEARPDADMDFVNEQIRNPPPEVDAAYARLGEAARKFRAMKAAKSPTKA